MEFANYKVFGRPGQWHVEHDGRVDNTYETKESAFEAAAAAASNVLRQGHEIMITAPGSAGAGETTTGARWFRLAIHEPMAAGSAVFKG